MQSVQGGVHPTVYRDIDIGWPGALGAGLTWGNPDCTHAACTRHANITAAASADALSEGTRRWPDTL